MASTSLTAQRPLAAAASAGEARLGRLSLEVVADDAACDARTYKAQGSRGIAVPVEPPSGASRRGRKALTQQNGTQHRRLPTASNGGHKVA